MIDEYLFSLKYNMFILREWYDDGKYDVHTESELHYPTDEEFSTYFRLSPTCVQPKGKTTGFENGKITWVDCQEWIKDKVNNIRNKRGQLLSEIDAIVSNPLRYGEFTEKQKRDVAAYRLELLDVPQQAGFPDDVIFPETPSVLKQ